MGRCEFELDISYFLFMWVLWCTVPHELEVFGCRDSRWRIETENDCFSSLCECCNVVLASYPSLVLENLLFKRLTSLAYLSWPHSFHSIWYNWPATVLSPGWPNEKWWSLHPWPKFLSMHFTVTCMCLVSCLFNISVVFKLQDTYKNYNREFYIIY